MTALIDAPAPSTITIGVDIEDQVAAACRAIAPQWGLRDLVAVNPYVGHAGHDLLAAEDLMQRRHHAAVLPAWSSLRQAWRTGRFTASDLATVHRPGHPELAFITTQLVNDRGDSPAPARCLSIAGVLDRRTGGEWLEAVVADLGRFLAARCDLGVGRWAMTDHGGLWATWRTWMRHDRSMAARGLGGFNAWVAELPPDAAATRAALLNRLGLTSQELADYLGRLLGEIQGWAGWLRQESWHTGIGDLPDLLTMRLAYDLALQELLAPPAVRPHLPPAGVSSTLERDRAARLVAVEAWEHAVRSALLKKIHPVPATPRARPDVQAVFCIDVRSEGLRHHLERTDPAIETYGFAGFFAMFVSVAGEERPQCPVLLQAGQRIGLAPAPAARTGRLLGAFRRSPGGGFAYMETAGPVAAMSLAAGSLGQGHADHHDEDAALSLQAIPAEARLGMLRVMLANLGLARPYARLLLLCGHDSTVANNPQAAGLACGACGGHSGAINARVAAALYNDPDLRVQLKELAPPADSIAVAAVHDTATDIVRLLDTAAVPTSHTADLERLRQALDRAGHGQRTARASGLPGLPSGGGLLARLLARSRDWAELRPEWGLANNAAFIAAPRSMTLGSDLGGRCFLHSYDAALDSDGAVLALILTAPVVVASWINLQYWASSVDPNRLGSGNKALHSVVGGIGVSAGADADLLPGLAWQSVHDGMSPRHEPIRLHVMVAADPARIDAVVTSHGHLRDLVTNQWIVLHALDPVSGACQRRMPGGGWTILP